MSWNYRVMAHDYDGEIYLEIHEVYYNSKKVPDSYTFNSVGVGGENIKELEWVLQRMKEALNKPILWAGEKFPQEYK